MKLRNKIIFECFDTVNEIAADCELKLLRKIEVKCREYHDIFNYFDPNSELSKLNNTGKSVSCSDALLACIHLSKEMAKLTNYAFDPSFRGRCHDYDKIEIENKTVRLPEGMKLDFGGLAKGYIADCILIFLENHHVERALINLGGNIVGVNRQDDQVFQIGLREHGSVNHRAFAITSLLDGTVVCSGTDQRGNHIIDPLTQKPVLNQIQTVAIKGFSSFLADALSTALFVMEEREGINLVRSLNCHALILKKDGKIIADEGFDFSLIKKAG